MPACALAWAQALQRGDKGELDGLPDELRVGHLPHVDPGDERAELREDLHEVLVGEQDEALSHRGARHRQLRGEVVLRQGRTGRELAADDATAQLFVHDNAGRPMTGCTPSHSDSIPPTSMVALVWQ